MRRRSWNEFKGVAARVLPDEIRSSINPTGEITFDIKTYRKMGEPQAMLLLYEESTRSIGLKPAHPDAPNAVLVRVRHAKTNRVVRSAPFLWQNGIVIPTTLRFPYPALEDNVLVLDLRTAVVCGKGGWKKAKRLRKPEARRVPRSVEELHEEALKRDAQRRALMAEKKRLREERELQRNMVQFDFGNGDIRLITKEQARRYERLRTDWENSERGKRRDPYPERKEQPAKDGQGTQGF